MKKLQQQQEADRCFISALSIDLLVHVLDSVPESGDRKSFALACRAFFRAESAHRRTLRILRRDRLLPLLRRYPAVEALDLSSCPALNDEALVAAAGEAGRCLRRIDLSRASGVGWRGLEAAVELCPALEAVDLSHCVGVGDREAAAVAGAPRLREVRLDKCLGVTDVGLARVAVACGRRLETLSIKWCYQISDIGIELLVKKCTDLRALDLSYLKITNKSLQAIASLDKLEVLSMVGCSQINDEGLKFLNNGSNSLRNIDFSRCENVTSSGLISVIEGHRRIENINIGDCFPDLSPAFVSRLSVLKASLSSLKLDGFQVSPFNLQTIGRGSDNLVEISLSKCHGVNDEGVCELVSNGGDLRSTDLTCCRLLTDKALSAVAANCRKLECLKLESCPLITEKGLDQIGTHCPELREIDLTDCNINDTALKFLSKCSKLTTLKLGLCSSVTDEGLAHIASNCGCLQELDLYRCTEVTDNGLASLANCCKKLKKLNLCYCDKITDQGMKHLSSLKELSDLEMRALRCVTSLGITAVAMGCSSLTELDLKRCYAVDDVAVCALAQHSPNIRQINISYCAVSAIGLCNLLGNLRCLQDAKLVHLTKVPVEGYEFALRVSCGRLKKLKLVEGLKKLLSPGLLQILQARGCRLRCVNKPLKV